MQKTYLPFIFLLLFSFANPISPSENTKYSLGEGTVSDRFYVHSPPDPVNVRTGNFYLPIQDLYLPCFGFPLEVLRAYNSFSTRNGPFGAGWTFNYDLQITVGSYGTLRVVEHDGFINEFQPMSGSKTPKGDIIDKIIEAKKAEDKRYLRREKSEEYYDEMRIKLDTNHDYFKRLSKRYIKSEDETPDGTYISTLRGPFTLVKHKGGFTRTKRDGTREYYDKKGYIRKIVDINGNNLLFGRDSRDRIAKVADGCGHYLIIKYNRKDKIIQMIDSLGRILKYEYDGLDYMMKSIDAEGNIVAYEYNKKKLLEKITYEKNKTTEISYDKLGRVTEQRGPGKKITKYRYGTKGKNQRWLVVKDNQGYYEKFDFYKRENKTIQTDKSGKQTVTTFSKVCSKPLSITDAGGKGEFFEYDSIGRLTVKRDSKGGLVNYSYEPRFDKISEIKEQNGRKLSFLYDSRGNLTYANLHNKGWVRIRYETHGKPQSLADSKGNIINFAYNYFGMPTLIQKKEKNKTVGSIYVKYHPQGDIKEIKYKPDDVKIVEDIKQTYRDIFSLLKPSGIDFQI